MVQQRTAANNRARVLSVNAIMNAAYMVGGSLIGYFFPQYFRLEYNVVFHYCSGNERSGRRRYFCPQSLNFSQDLNSGLPAALNYHLIAKKEL